MPRGSFRGAEDHRLGPDRCHAREVPISAESLLRLQPELFVKLHRIVLGWVASDVDPAWLAKERERSTEDEAEAALAGRAIGDVRQEHDEKNC